MATIGNAPVFPTESVLPGNLQVTGNATVSGNATINGTTNSVGNLTENSNDVITTESNVAPKVPAFQVSSTSTAGLGINVVTKWPFNDISGNDFDTHSYFDTTNYRFTPQIAGYYWFNTIVQTGHNFGASTVAFIELWFYKNGTYYSPQIFFPVNLSGHYFAATKSELIYLNGSTDYVEVYMKQGGSNRFILGFLSQFQGYLVRS